MAQWLLIIVDSFQSKGASDGLYCCQHVHNTAYNMQYNVLCFLCSGWSGGAPVLAAGQDPVLARPPLLPLLDVHSHLHGVLHQAAARMQVCGD